MTLAPIGYFSKTHGIKGQLVLRAEHDFFTEEVKALFVELAGAKAPYFVSELRESRQAMFVVLEDIDSVEKARALVGKKVFIDAALLNKAEETLSWEGFELIDKQYGPLGNITAVSDNGHQVLLSVDHKGKEVILPLVEEFIEKIDEPQKKLFYNAPEGLIDVYLGGNE